MEDGNCNCEGSAVPEVLIHPNPATNRIQIEAGKRQDDIKKVSIYNASGAMAKSIVLPLPEDRASIISINVSDLATGVYFCKIHGTDWQSIKLFIIAK
jgi:hypothetical protein